VSRSRSRTRPMWLDPARLERRRRWLLRYAVLITALVFATYGAVLAGDRWLVDRLAVATVAVGVAYLTWAAVSVRRRL
jgi:hypothetical protein